MFFNYSSIEFLEDLPRVDLLNNSYGLLFIDLATMSFKKGIQIIEKYKSLQYKFRILLPKAKLIIGSDTANGKGEVVTLD